MDTLASTPPIRLRPLLLIGGQSSRMGSPKHLLVRPDGVRMYQYALNLLHDALPAADLMCVSIHTAKQADEIKPALPVPIKFLLDSPITSTKTAMSLSEIGPAAGLLAAFTYDPTVHWLVLACDYPLLTSSTVQQLMNAYEPPLTCFVNSLGYSEPLLAIWSPVALTRLNDNIHDGHAGPSRVVRDLGSRLIEPLNSEWLMGTNTQDEWNTAVRLLNASD